MDRLQEIIQLKNTIRQLESLQCYNNRDFHQNDINGETHKQVKNTLEQVINTKVWALLEHLDRLEKEG